MLAGSGLTRRLARRREARLRRRSIECGMCSESEVELVQALRDLDLEGRVRIVRRDSLDSMSTGDSPSR